MNLALELVWRRNVTGFTFAYEERDHGIDHEAGAKVKAFAFCIELQLGDNLFDNGFLLDDALELNSPFNHEYQLNPSQVRVFCGFQNLNRIIDEAFWVAVNFL